MPLPPGPPAARPSRGSMAGVVRRSRIPPCADLTAMAGTTDANRNGFSLPNLNEQRDRLAISKQQTPRPPGPRLVLAGPEFDLRVAPVRPSARVSERHPMPLADRDAQEHRLVPLDHRRDLCPQEVVPVAVQPAEVTKRTEQPEASPDAGRTASPVAEPRSERSALAAGGHRTGRLQGLVRGGIPSEERKATSNYDEPCNQHSGRWPHDLQLKGIVRLPLSQSLRGRTRAATDAMPSSWTSPGLTGHLKACASKPRKDGVSHAENPTGIPR